ncbi:MAG TPA: ATP-binding protein [Chlamydiales bacterium]|nr:ATP-binding protein [Chlamydiales bacterium]
MKKRPVFNTILTRLQESRQFMLVLLGPRQVGKTTLILQAAKELNKPYHYISADTATLQSLAWIEQQWEIARLKIDPKRGALLIIDEVHKIPHWSDIIKDLWDQDTRKKINLSVAILGSSPWLMQKGLSESLAGRFEILPITHWSFAEMEEIFHWSLDQYLYFGGYPGAASLADQEDPSRWMNYINDSLIETSLSRDILLMTQVNKPILLRRLFQLGCLYSSQILSYSKMLGELQEAGNTTTLAHYLELLSGAGLLCGLQKFARQPVRQKASSPKFCVYNTALMSAQSAKTFKEAKTDPIFWGRLVESAVGTRLLNAIRGQQIELFYWREKDKEVDFILKRGKSVVAIEVKSNQDGFHSGIDLFQSQFKVSKTILVGDQGIPMVDFLKIPLSKLME